VFSGKPKREVFREAEGVTFLKPRESRLK